MKNRDKVNTYRTAESWNDNVDRGTVAVCLDGEWGSPVSECFERDGHPVIRVTFDSYENTKVVRLSEISHLRTLEVLKPLQTPLQAPVRIPARSDTREELERVGDYGTIRFLEGLFSFADPDMGDWGSR